MDDRGKRIEYLDLLRIIASVMIVGVHAAATFIDRLTIPSADFFIACSWDVFAIYGVPLFVMISGALNLRLYSPPDSAGQRHDRSGGELRSCVIRALRFMAVYYLWLMFYNLLNCRTEGYGYSLLSIRRNVILAAFLGKGIYHLWFLPMLAGLTLATPLLRPIAADKKLCRYFIILSCITGILIPTVLRFNFRFHTVLEGIYGSIPFVVITGYTGYYLLGYYLAHHLDTGSITGTSRTRTAILLGVSCLISWAAASFICCRDSVAWGQLSTKMNDPFVVTDLICAVCIFLLVRILSAPASEASKRLLRPVSGATFGIYIIHPAIINIGSWFGLTTLFAPQIISLPVITALVYLLSLLLTVLFRESLKLLKNITGQR